MKLALRRIDWWLAGALAVLAAAAYALRPDLTVPNREFLPEMAYSQAGLAYSASSTLPAGQTMLAPAPRTIARGHIPLPYDATEADAKRAGLELKSPIAPDDAAALARGEALFATFCQPCHGPRGWGNGPVAKRGFPAPPSLMAPRARALREGQIFHIITHGQKTMPAYGTQIEPSDRWRVVAYFCYMQQW